MPAGTAISNTATAGYFVGASPATAVSNTLTITSVAMRTPSTLELLQHAPASGSAAPTTVRPTDYSTSATAAGPFIALAPPTAVGGGAIDLGAPVPLLPATQYHITEAMFIRLTDPDQNVDPLAVETVLITIRIPATGETEVVRLAETGPDTGIFSGYLQTGTGAAASGDGVLNCQPDSLITASYTDVADGTDTRSASILVDPNGLVFNSTAGLPVDGVTITITDAATGLDAVVFADDGVTPFPATVVTGSSFTVGATTYTFPPGGYRFPFVLPGNYQYRITTPTSYRAPSVVPTAQIQALPGGPFSIVPGSRGEIFIVNPGPALHIDIPVDPTNNALYVTKTAGKPAVSAGDALPYRVTVENVSAVNPVNSVVVNDRLPLGFRYRSGSTRIDGAAAADPSVSPDGRMLTYTLGTAAAGRTLTISYVAGVGAGARTGPAANTAFAAGALGATSNVATATVQVVEDLFRSTSTIVGRLSFDGCGDPDRSPDKGEKIRLDGVRVFLEDGAAVVTDKNGMFHFEAVKPGTHVVQLDVDTLPGGFEAALCSEHTRFAGRGFSQFVDLQGGALWRADFHLALKPRMLGSVGIELTSHIPAPSQAGGEKENEAPRNRLEYRAAIQNAVVPLRNVRLTVTLPPGVTYLTGSSRLSESPLAEPFIMEDTLTYRLPDIAGDWTGTVRFETAVTPPSGTDRLIARALLTVDTPDAPGTRTPVAENTREIKVLEKRMAVPDMVLRPRFKSLNAHLSKQDRDTLDKVIRKLRPLVIQRLSVAGHTDSIPIKGKGLNKFKDNYALSEARAKAVSEYLAKSLKLQPGQIEIIARGPDDPVATNDTPKGRAENRRVELKVYKELVIAWAEVADASTSSSRKTVETVGLRPREVWEYPAVSKEEPMASGADSMPTYGQTWLETAQPGLELLWPPDGHHPTIPSIKIAVKHLPEERIFLRLNSADVAPLFFDGLVKRTDNAVAVSRWSGVHLADGDNIIEVDAFDSNGVRTGGFSRTIHYSGPPETVELVPERSVLVADGRTPPVIAVRLLDRQGHPARRGVVGEFTVDPPHLPFKRSEDLQQEPLLAPATIRENYLVGDDGVALVRLQPTTLTGDAVIRLTLLSGEQEVRVWLASEDREWVLVGLAEGTAGYNTLSGNMEGLNAADVEEDFYDDGRLAFYAKGRIQGKWLLTMAYDSDKKWRKDEQSLQEVIDPNRYYLLYGDAAEQRPDAPSMRSLYLKLERGQFYALFGDYATGLTMTELSRYNRAFNGFKTEFKSRTLDVTAFASDTNQGFIKDEIRGDGTSGLYRLSRRNVVLNSETVTIETRDRFRSEVVVSSERMSRWLDYTIDYESGTIFFKAPVFSRDGSFNPVFIVVDYESCDSGDLSWNYGGRAAVRPIGRQLEVGATHVHEAAVGKDGDLSGVDATVRLDGQTKVRAEIASTRNESGAVTTKGEAYLAEIVYRSQNVEGTAYVREQEPGFGLGQQRGSESGARKLGFYGLYRIDRQVSVRGQAFRQENLGTESVRDMAEIEGRYAGGKYEFGSGFRFAEDEFIAGEARTSEQVFVNARYRMTDRLSLGFGHDQSLSRKNDNGDFPTRSTLTAEYRISSTATLFAAQELTQGPAGDTAATRLGFRASPWTGSAMTSSLEEQYTERGTRLFAVSGLKQTWQLSSHWSVDAGLDRSATMRQTDTQPFNVNVPPASGGEDFTAVSLGAGYRTKWWSWTGRVEQRHAETEDKQGLLMGAVGEPWKWLGLTAGLHAFRTESVRGTDRTNVDLRLGLAYRPPETEWIVLDRLEYRVEEQKNTTQRIDSRRIVNNMVLNCRLAPRYQVSFQYGAKYVAETIDALDYGGYTDLTGIELRYDITRKWDIGIRGSVLNTRETGQMDYGTGVSAGYTIADNMWFSVGYNITGFRDRDFSRADYTGKGFFLKLRMKFDQASVRDAIKWFSGQ